jgi:hypothetical protein
MQENAIAVALKSAKDTVKKDSEKNSITIGKDVYKVKILSASEGIATWEYLMKKLLPSVGTGLDSFRHDEVLDGSPTTFAEAFMHLSNRLDGNSLVSISGTLLAGLEVNGKEVDFDEHFKANYGSWAKVIKFALMENFESFFVDGWTTTLTDLVSLAVPMLEKE